MPAFHPTPQVAEEPKRRLCLRTLTQLPTQIEEEISLIAAHRIALAAQQFVDDLQRATPTARRRDATYHRHRRRRNDLRFDNGHRK